MWVRPAAAGARFTSDYGPRFSPGGIGSTWHRGIDLAPRVAGARGFPVLAATGGRVVASGHSSVRGYWLVQRADDGSHLRYQHFAGPTLGAGAQLAAGQILGSMGATGAATGPHLHFETFNPGASWSSSTNATDPEPFMRARGVDLRTGVSLVTNPVGSRPGDLPDINLGPIAPIPEEDMPLNQSDLEAIDRIVDARIRRVLRAGEGDEDPGVRLVQPALEAIDRVIAGRLDGHLRTRDARMVGAGDAGVLISQAGKEELDRMIASRMDERFALIFAKLGIDAQGASGA